MVVLVAITAGCQSSWPAHVRADLVNAFGAPFDSWSDARIDRSGEQVCTRLDSNLSPSDPADAPRWIHYFPPGYCRSSTPLIARSVRRISLGPRSCRFPLRDRESNEKPHHEEESECD